MSVNRFILILLMTINVQRAFARATQGDPPGGRVLTDQEM
jgi:hypothetical protein